MNLLKAMEIINLNIKEAGKKMPPDVKSALQIGVEAINREYIRRRFAIPDMVDLLPGETQD